MSPKILDHARSAARAIALSAAAITAQPAIAAQELTRAQVEQLCTNPDDFIRASGYSAECAIVTSNTTQNRVGVGVTGTLVTLLAGGGGYLAVRRRKNKTDEDDTPGLDTQEDISGNDNEETPVGKDPSSVDTDLALDFAVTQPARHGDISTDMEPRVPYPTDNPELPTGNEVLITTTAATFDEESLAKLRKEQQDSYTRIIDVLTTHGIAKDAIGISVPDSYSDQLSLFMKRQSRKDGAVVITEMAILDTGGVEFYMDDFPLLRGSTVGEKGDTAHEFSIDESLAMLQQ